MRIAWLTPLSSTSAIGKIAARIAGEFRDTAEIDLWSADRGDLLPSPVPVVRYTVSDSFERMLRLYDAVLYNFGDHYGFHRDVFLMSRRVPGIAILHDVVMHHFFMGLYLEDSSSSEQYVAAMTRLYGSEGRAAALASFEQQAGVWRVKHDPPPLWETDGVVDYPLFEETLRNVTGVVVHSDFFKEKVSRATDAPVARLFLPGALSPSAAPAPREALKIPADRTVLLTVGHVNPNKRVLEVVESLGRHPDLASRVLYVIAGKPPAGRYAADLRATIARHGLEQSIRLVGSLPDDDLRAWLDHAEICVNLRHPVMEGASASLADQLAFGKAVVVTNAGVYAELPGDAVMKIAPGREVDEFPGVLRRLLDDPAGRAAVARRGYDYAASRMRADRYAADLLEVINASGGFAAMARYADNVGAVLQQLGVQPGMRIVDRIARESADLFSEPKTSAWQPGTDPWRGR